MVAFRQKGAFNVLFYDQPAVTLQIQITPIHPSHQAFKTDKIGIFIITQAKITISLHFQYIAWP